MSKRKDRQIKSKRASSFPPCYGGCGRCFLTGKCGFYAEWKADQYAAAVKEEAARQQAKWANYG